MDNLGPLIGLGVDLSVLYVLNSWYKSLNKTANDIKKAPKIRLDGDVIKDIQDSKAGCIPYAYVEGEVMATNQALVSHYIDGRSGVVHHFTMVEHKSKSVQGIWTEVKKIIQERMQMVPFVLRRVLDNNDTRDIHVHSPSDADLLTDALTVTYDHYEPSGSSFLTRVVDRISGEVTKGYQETEKMLLSGTIVRGLGEVALSKGKLELRPPTGGLKYILTTMTRKEVIKHYQQKSFWVRIAGYVTGFVGMLILVHIIKKTYRRIKENRERQEIVDEIRRMRENRANDRNNGAGAGNVNTAAASDEENNDVPMDNACVVCLSMPREIVLLNCGHICVCAECLHALPHPLKCPVCRQSVERYVTIYHP